jgi:hypothetical protein
VAARPTTHSGGPGPPLRLGDDRVVRARADEGAADERLGVDEGDFDHASSLGADGHRCK